MVRRVENWPRLLSEYVNDARKLKFKWGENDCLQYSAKWVEVATGSNFYSSYPEYSTKEDAQEILIANGGITKIVNSALGSGHRDYKKASRGDVALVKTPELTMGIVADDGVTISVLSENGETRYPVSAGWRFWRV